MCLPESNRFLGFQGAACSCRIKALCTNTPKHYVQYIQKRPPRQASFQKGFLEVNAYRSLLKRTRLRLETAVFDEGTPPRDLASLTRRLLEVSQEIERLESENGGANAPTATEVEDEPFDPREV